MRGPIVGAITVASIALIGCDRLQRLASGGPDTKVPATEDAKVPATERECVQFAADLQAAVDANDKVRTSNLIGLAEPYKTAVADFDGTPAYRKGLTKSCVEKAARHPFVPLLLAKVRNGGQFKLLRVHTVDGRPRALFRTIRANGIVG